MASRKTVDVQAVKKRANLLLGLKNESENTPEFRRGVIGMVEFVLFETGNYKGFKYRYSEWDVERNQLRAGYDDTRREYY
jgi:hypothetical protein